MRTLDIPLRARLTSQEDTDRWLERVRQLRAAYRPGSEYLDSVPLTRLPKSDYLPEPATTDHNRKGNPT